MTLSRQYDYFFFIHFNGASQMGLVVKNLLASAGDARDAGLSPGSGRFLEKEIATCSSILSWKTR